MSKFYITTSIPYANSTPHLGNVLDSVYADVLARYKRQRQEEVWFLTGTDEHGVKIVRTAEREGLTPQELVDKNSATFRGLKDALNLSWDDFIRTSDRARHYPGASKLWQAISNSGDLYKKIYRGLYCVGHEAFVTPKDLTPEGICKDHQKKPEAIEEENWFFRLSKYGPAIQKVIESGKLKIIPESRSHEILSFIKDGLQDVSFSRPKKDLSWGVPVPGDDMQTMYVWADALANYISALGYGSTDEANLKKYWPADVQVIGKDNLRFHAAIWPGMLLSAGLPLPGAIFVHGFLNVEGQKISKTVGNLVDPYALVKKYGTDAVRYYLLREFSSAEDGDYSEEKFIARYNGDLANGLGNLVARVFALVEKKGEVKISPQDSDASIAEAMDLAHKDVSRLTAEFKFNEALARLWELVALGDKYVNDKKPWAEKDNSATLFNALQIIDSIAALLYPFLPATSEVITKNIHWGENIVSVLKVPPLFPRI